MKKTKPDLEFTVDHFIEKFESIPDDHWGTGTYVDSDGRCCAIGFCRSSREHIALRNILIPHGGAAAINDGHSYDYQQPTPKARILAALADAKEAGR